MRLYIIMLQSLYYFEATIFFNNYIIYELIYLRFCITKTDLKIYIWFGSRSKAKYLLDIFLTSRSWFGSVLPKTWSDTQSTWNILCILGKLGNNPRYAAGIFIYFVSNCYFSIIFRLIWINNLNKRIIYLI